MTESSKGAPAPVSNPIDVLRAILAVAHENGRPYLGGYLSDDLLAAAEAAVNAPMSIRIGEDHARLAHAFNPMVEEMKFVGDTRRNVAAALRFMAVAIPAIHMYGVGLDEDLVHGYYMLLEVCNSVIEVTK